MMRDLARRAVLRGLPAALAPSAARFRLALRRPAGEQARLKRRFAAELAQTAYGRSLGVRSAADWANVPVVTYDELEPWLTRQRTEEGAVVTPEPVLFYEPTSGSAGRAKLIPYTARKRHALRDLFAVWAYDVLRHGPTLRTGKLYLSVSPHVGPPRTTTTGRPIGLDDDTAYLGRWLQALIGAFWVGPRAGSRHADIEAFKDAVALAWLLEPELEVISVWSPSFLDVLLDHITAHATRLARALPPDRARHLAPEPDWVQLWPALKVVSCWNHGAAGPLAERLTRRLPQAWVQGKGLLATEAAVTVPWIRAHGCVPLVHHTLIELQAADGQLLPLVEARLGETYEIVVTTAGGLFRYRLGDRVVVSHHHRSVPCLRFVGRTGGVSDLVGEKLQAQFVSTSLNSVLPDHPGLATLVPVLGSPAHYLLVSDRPIDPGAVVALDEALCDAHHYGLARSLGQLGPLRAVVAEEAGRWLAEREMRRGLRWGDIKPQVLQVHPADEALRAALGSARAQG